MKFAANLGIPLQNKQWAIVIPGKSWTNGKLFQSDKYSCSFMLRLLMHQALFKDSVPIKFLPNLPYKSHLQWDLVVFLEMSMDISNSGSKGSLLHCSTSCNRDNQFINPASKIHKKKRGNTLLMWTKPQFFRCKDTLPNMNPLGSQNEHPPFGQTFRQGDTHMRKTPFIWCTHVRFGRQGVMCAMHRPHRTSEPYFLQKHPEKSTK